jgi:hypothetical protein
MKYLSSFTLLFLVFTVQDAAAYIDPGSGSYIFQLTIAALLGVAMAIKLFWRKVIAYFTKVSFKRRNHG